MTTPVPDRQPTPAPVPAPQPADEQPTGVHATAALPPAVPQYPAAHREPSLPIPAPPSPPLPELVQPASTQPAFTQPASTQLELPRSTSTPPAFTELNPTPPNGMPQNGMPLPHQPPPAPPTRPSRAPIVALTALAAVFAVVAGLFTTLYVGERSGRDTTATTRADKERALADLGEQQEEADATLGTNRSRESALSAEHALLTECVDAAKAYFDLPAVQSPESSRLFRVMYDVCPQI